MSFSYAALRSLSSTKLMTRILRVTPFTSSQHSLAGFSAAAMALSAHSGALDMPPAEPATIQESPSGAPRSGVTRGKPLFRPGKVTQITSAPPGKLFPARPPLTRWSHLWLLVRVRKVQPMSASYREVERGRRTRPSCYFSPTLQAADHRYPSVDFANAPHPKLLGFSRGKSSGESLVESRRRSPQI